MPSTHGLARATASELDDLDSTLIDAANASTRALPAVRGGADEGRAGEDNELAEARHEIIGVYRQGVEIASSVEVVPLVALLKASKQPVPPLIALAARDHQFSLLQMVFSIRLPADVSPGEAEFAAAFRCEDSAPVVTNFFPQETRETVASAKLKAEVGLTASLSFGVPKELSALAGGAGNASGSVTAGGESAFLVGPLNFEIKRARVLADGMNSHRVQWRYVMASDLANSSEFQSWVVLKTPTKCKGVRMDAALGVLPFKKRWLVFKDHLKPMRDTLKLEIEL
jgi:hypothetical protein